MGTWHKYRVCARVAFWLTIGLTSPKFFASSSKEEITQDAAKEQSFLSRFVVVFVICLQIVTAIWSFCESWCYIRDVFLPALDRYQQHLDRLDKEIRSMNEAKETMACISREHSLQKTPRMREAERTRMMEAVAAAVALYQQINGSLDALDEQDKVKYADSSSDDSLDSEMDTVSDSASDRNTDLSSVVSSASKPIGVVGRLTKPRSKTKSKSKSKSKSKAERKAIRRGSNQQCDVKNSQLPKTKDVAVEPRDWDSDAWAQARDAVADRIDRRRTQLNTRSYTNTTD